MRICFLSSAHPPQDKRVFGKEAVSLAQAGFEVVHLAPGDGEARRLHGVELVTYLPPRGPWGRLLQIPRLYARAARLRADCYHCNEVDSWIAGVLLKLRHRARVVFDVHEHYPSRFEGSRLPRWLRPAGAAAVRLLFRLLLPFTDRLVFAKRSVAADFRGAEAKQVLVENFASLTHMRPEAVDSPKCESSPPSVTAIHLGLISRARGWPQLLEALGLVSCRDLRLHVVGTFNDGSREAFDARVHERGLADRVWVDDWMPFEEAYACILASQIGLILFQPGIQNHVYALPHKMFDYMMAERPLVAPAFAEEVAAIVRETDCGVLVDPADPADIAAALDRLAGDAPERERLGHNGRQAVVERYNWETEAGKLVAMYRELAGDTA